MRSNDRLRFSRRSVLRLLSLGGGATLITACSPAPAASPTTAPVKPADAAKPAAPATAAPAASTTAFSDADWAKLVDAAKAEGKLALATYSGTGFRVIAQAFQDAFPGITVEHSQFQSSSRDFVPRLLQEHKASLYTWDIATMPTQEMLRQARPANAIEPIRPLVVRPDLIEDKTWRDSYEGGFNDLEKRWGYTISRDVETQVWINTDMVKEGEITKLEDLLDPKWRGKMVGGDPRTKGSGFVPTTMMRVTTKSDDIVKKLWVDQEVVVGTDARQLTEQMVRGRYPVSVGAVDRRILADFRSQGLGHNLAPVPIPGIDYTNGGSNSMWLLSKAPHPNAAKLFVNWILMREPSEIWAKNAQSNSRRADVAAYDEEVAMKPGVSYLRSDAEEYLEEMGKSQEIAKALLN